MLFHITHVHSGHSCPFHDPDVVGKTFAKVVADTEESGLKLLGGYADAPGHAMYFVVDADDARQIQTFLDPIIDMGDADIRPVTDFAALVRERMSAG